ncbi:hypothetical protein BT63DRAFT_455575 [Microthyrium microscopicum]|uniref:Uncharacterized protein n=1 Tax=Microthyrium microscopicum TaxID=703497 RepID=A0A6A6UBG6_9PEZI|nr:hypothetical protein BT63DRAFT_455575 [Microthyrium microscopicum]
MESANQTAAKSEPSSAQTDEQNEAQVNAHIAKMYGIAMGRIGQIMTGLGFGHVPRVAQAPLFKPTIDDLNNLEARLQQLMECNVAQNPGVTFSALLRRSPLGTTILDRNRRPVMYVNTHGYTCSEKTVSAYWAGPLPAHIRDEHHIQKPTPLVPTEKAEKPWPRDCPLCQESLCHLLCPYLKKAEEEKRLKRESSFGSSRVACFTSNLLYTDISSSTHAYRDADSSTATSFAPFLSVAYSRQHKLHQHAALSVNTFLQLRTLFPNLSIFSFNCRKTPSSKYIHLNPVPGTKMPTIITDPYRRIYPCRHAPYPPLEKNSSPIVFHNTTCPELVELIRSAWLRATHQMAQLVHDIDLPDDPVAY